MRLQELPLLAGEELQAYRLVNSKFPPIALFDDVADAADFEVLYQLQEMTNPRLQNEVGRLELIPGAPDVLCDAAHNVDACAELARYLDDFGAPYARRVLLFGVLRDKDHPRMLKLLLPRFDEVVFVTPASPRAVLSGALRARFGGAAGDAVC